MFVLGRILLLAVLVLAGLSLYMMLFEHRYIYFPSREIAATPADAGMPFETVAPVTSDGVTLHGWFMPASPSRFTVLHFHGNAGNIADRLLLYRRWHAMGLSVYAVDYRGYGNSEGEPGEAGLYEDARAAWRDVGGRLGIRPQQLIIAGRSLGAAVAAKLANEVEAAGIVLETPFTSIPDMAAWHYPWLPLRWLARSRFDTEAYVRNIRMPLLLIHAASDTIAPAWMAERIEAAAQAPKRRAVLPGGHNDFDGGAYASVWQAWLDQLREHAP